MNNSESAVTAPLCYKDHLYPLEILLEHQFLPLFCFSVLCTESFISRREITLENLPAVLSLYLQGSWIIFTANFCCYWIWLIKNVKQGQVKIIK